MKRMLADIECLRQRLYDVVAIYGIDSTQALTISQKLDSELNSFYRLQTKIEKIA